MQCLVLNTFDRRVSDCLGNPGAADRLPEILGIDIWRPVDQNLQSFAERGFERSNQANPVVGDQLLLGPAIEAPSVVGDRPDSHTVG